MDAVAFLWLVAGACCIAALFTERAMGYLGLALFALGCLLAFGRTQDWW